MAVDKFNETELPGAAVEVVMTRESASIVHFLIKQKIKDACY